MGEMRAPVRHRRLPRRNGGTAAERAVRVAVTPPPPGDLQAVFATLARRAKLPTGPEATPGIVLRAAALPLLMASVMTGAQALPVSAATATPALPQPAPDGWTVTSHASPVTPQPTARTGQPHVTYVVQPGDTLTGICNQHGVNLRKVLTLNQLRMDSVIRPGQWLLLPATPARAPARHGRPERAYPLAVTAAAKANRRTLAQRKLPSQEQVKVMIVTTAEKHGVDPVLALAVAYQESGFEQRTVSPANAVGVMQIVPSSGNWVSSLLGEPLDLLDTRDNITAGVVLLAALAGITDTEPQAIAGYYQGLSSVRKNGMFDDTKRYVANVQIIKARFTKTR